MRALRRAFPECDVRIRGGRRRQFGRQTSFDARNLKGELIDFLTKGGSNIGCSFGECVSLRAVRRGFFPCFE